MKENELLGTGLESTTRCARAEQQTFVQMLGQKCNCHNSGGNVLERGQRAVNRQVFSACGTYQAERLE